MIRARRIVSMLALCAALAVAAAGCHKKVAAAPPMPPPPAPTPTAPPPPPAPAPAPAPTPAPAPQPLSEDEVFARKSVDQLNAEKPLNDVFFELDRVEIQDQGRSVLQREVEGGTGPAAVRAQIEAAHAALAPPPPPRSTNVVL